MALVGAGEALAYVACHKAEVAYGLISSWALLVHCMKSVTVTKVWLNKIYSYTFYFDTSTQGDITHITVHVNIFGCKYMSI